MVNSHLELGQLWRCPVEWCTVWKGSVRDCLGHLNDKLGGSTFFALKNVAKFFPPWTVTREVWQTALRPDVSGIAVDACLFHEAGCRLVHRYRVHKDPFPHPALRGGGCFLIYCPSWFGRWPSLNLHSSGFPFPHRGRRLARYQPIVFRVARHLWI